MNAQAKLKILVTALKSLSKYTHVTPPRTLAMLWWKAGKSPFTAAGACGRRDSVHSLGWSWIREPPEASVLQWATPLPRGIPGDGIRRGGGAQTLGIQQGPLPGTWILWQVLLCPERRADLRHQSGCSTSPSLALSHHDIRVWWYLSQCPLLCGFRSQWPDGWCILSIKCLWAAAAALPCPGAARFRSSPPLCSSCCSPQDGPEWALAQVRGDHACQGIPDTLPFNSRSCPWHLFMLSDGFIKMLVSEGDPLLCFLKSESKNVGNQKPLGSKQTHAFSVSAHTGWLASPPTLEAEILPAIESHCPGGRLCIFNVSVYYWHGLKNLQCTVEYLCHLNTLVIHLMQLMHTFQ